MTFLRACLRQNRQRIWARAVMLTDWSGSIYTFARYVMHNNTRIHKDTADSIDENILSTAPIDNNFVFERSTTAATMQAQSFGHFARKQKTKKWLLKRLINSMINHNSVLHELVFFASFFCVRFNWMNDWFGCVQLHLVVSCLVGERMHTHTHTGAR